MTVTAGTPDAFPQVRIFDRSSDEPLYVLHGAEYYDDNHASMGSRIVVRFDDLFDDSHDRCYEFESKVVALTMEYVHEAGFRGRAYLARVRHYGPEGLTPEKWLKEKSGDRSSEIVTCNPDTCPYGYEHPHRIGGPYVPPSQRILSPYGESGPRAVEVEFLWRDDAPDVVQTWAVSDE